MTTQAVSCQLMLNTGESVNLLTTITDGSEQELLTSGVVQSGGGVSAQSIGTFADGKVITQIIQPVTAVTKIVYAYISRRGIIEKILPIASGNVTSQPSPCSFMLQAGDSIRVLTVASASARNCAYNVVTTSGVNAIFTVTPTTAANNQLTHILTQQSIGESLSGQRIMSHYLNSTDGAKYRGGSVLVLSDRGLPVGSCIAVDQTKLQVLPNMAGTCGLQLNFQAQVITTS
jgi:hypothetical protein